MVFEGALGRIEPGGCDRGSTAGEETKVGIHVSVEAPYNITFIEHSPVIQCRVISADKGKSRDEGERGHCPGAGSEHGEEESPDHHDW